MIMPTVKCTKQKVESVKSNRVNAIWFYFSKGVWASSMALPWLAISNSGGNNSHNLHVQLVLGSILIPAFSSATAPSIGSAMFS